MIGYDHSVFYFFFELCQWVIKYSLTKMDVLGVNFKNIYFNAMLLISKKFLFVWNAVLLTENGGSFIIWFCYLPKELLKIKLLTPFVKKNMFVERKYILQCFFSSLQWSFLGVLKGPKLIYKKEKLFLLFMFSNFEEIFIILSFYLDGRRDFIFT